MVLVHVTRSAFPPSLDNYRDQIESDGVTNVLVVDNVGADVFESGVQITGQRDPSIKRGQFTDTRVRAFRRALSELCSA